MSSSATSQAPEVRAPARSARRGRAWAAEVAAVGAVIAVSGVVEYLFRHLLTLPFWGDEDWRAYDIGLGAGFLHQLNTSGAPLAFGWVAIEDGARLLFGSTEAGLRLPMFIALPGVGIATYLLARRWLGIAVSAVLAMLLIPNSWMVNNALQLKSYTYEALFSIAAVALYFLLRRAGQRPAWLLGLYAVLGLTCVFSLPNLFVVGPLLALDLVAAIRSRQQLLLRVAGEALAGGVALVHYVLFVSPQSAVADTGFWTQQYVPHKLSALGPFLGRSLASFFPGMVTGVAGVVDANPAYRLPTPARDFLAIVLAVLLVAGIVAAVRDAAGRVLVAVTGGALLLEFVAAAAQRWPFGMERTNIFLLPLLYILMAIGAVWLARLAAGKRAAAQPATRHREAGRDQGRLAWWRYAALGTGTVALAAAGLTGGVATAHALAQSAQMQNQPTIGSGNRAAVEQARALASPDDIAIIRSDRSPAIWYAGAWLYYMHNYTGYPARVAADPAVPAANTIAVVYVTPAAVDAFLQAHRGSPAVFLMENNLPGEKFPASLHQDSLGVLRQFGYCQVRMYSFANTGRLTLLTRAACNTSPAPK